MANEQLKNIVKDFVYSDSQLQEVYKRFCREITGGLHKDTHEKSDIKCWITYVQDIPTGDEKGYYLALDLGGSNFRVLLVILEGDRQSQLKSDVFPISHELMAGHGDKLFDYIAKCLEEFVNKMDLANKNLPLGFTFSFPCEQLSLESARLVHWTKGFSCPGVENHDVGRLLHEAIKRNGNINIEVMAILNDTTGTLMSCAYLEPDCRVGVIIGTGCNACYLERSQCAELLEDEYKTSKNVIINCEWGAFGVSGTLEFIRTDLDKEIDEKSANKGSQFYEKMISGMYLGELVRLLFHRAVDNDVMFANDPDKLELIKFLAQNEDCIQTSDLSNIEADDPEEMTFTLELLRDRLHMKNATIEDCLQLRFISGVVVKRSVNLAALGISGLLNKINEPRVVVGIDGSLYKLYPTYNASLKEVMRKYVHPKVQFEVMLSEDGSGRGAALVAAVAAANSFPSLISQMNEDFIQFLASLMLTDAQMEEIYKLINEEVDKGLGKETNPTADIKCVLSYVQDFPSGEERGDYLALDFGGSNFRVLLVTLEGDRKSTLKSDIYPISRELMVGPGNKLFDYLIKCLEEFIATNNLKDKKLPLAFTFSFPCMQKGLTSAILVRWTKGFNCSGVENEDIGRLLNEAIVRNGNLNIEVVAILNDTTGTLVSCAYLEPECRLAFILGTGCNACYVERSENVQLLEEEYKTKEFIIINTEWEAFGDSGILEPYRTIYDRKVDEKTANKGFQIFEKMISGMYMGWIVRHILQDAILNNFILVNDPNKSMALKILAENDDCIKTSDVSSIEADNPKLMPYTTQFLREILKLDTEANIEDCRKFKFICAVVSKRSAELVAIGLSGLINRMNMPKIIIGMDGALCRFHPKIRPYIKEVLKKFVTKGLEYELMLSEDGSGRGAALLAATVAKNN